MALPRFLARHTLATVTTLRRLLAVLLVLALPLQGLAAFAPAMPCGEAHAAMHGTGDSGAPAHHAGTAHDQHLPEQGDSTPAGPGNGHSCCHHVFTGAPMRILPSVQETPGTVTPRIALLATLFIPDLPQRPPRA